MQIVFLTFNICFWKLFEICLQSAVNCACRAVVYAMEKQSDHRQRYTITYIIIYKLFMYKYFGEQGNRYCTEKCFSSHESTELTGNIADWLIVWGDLERVNGWIEWKSQLQIVSQSNVLTHLSFHCTFPVVWRRQWHPLCDRKYKRRWAKCSWIGIKQGETDKQISRKVEKAQQKRDRLSLLAHKCLATWSRAVSPGHCSARSQAHLSWRISTDRQARGTITGIVCRKLHFNCSEQVGSKQGLDQGFGLAFVMCNHRVF